MYFDVNENIFCFCNTLKLIRAGNEPKKRKVTIGVGVGQPVVHLKALCSLAVMVML